MAIQSSFDTTTGQYRIGECLPPDPTDGECSKEPVFQTPYPFQVAPPHGYAAIVNTFGDISVKDGKVITAGWESANMKMVSDLPGWPRRLYINKAVEVPLREALRRCVALYDGYVIKTLGCFSPRSKRTSARLSTHSWGIAMDLNAASNPMANPMQKDLPDAWVAIWESFGWTWGGRFPTPDPMHFQFASGY